ncbi:MAG: YqgE/AlgH family protein [Planctomycetota bacterium]|nr:MAG: YqgE/AlgH family protein [Planctomycetota bacterium]
MAILRSGAILVAQPELLEAHFVRSIIYLLEHHAGGSMGVIINRPLPMGLGTVWEDCPKSLKDSCLVAAGGPVDMHKGLLLHRFHGIPEAFPVAQDIAIGGQSEALRERLAKVQSAQTRPLRLFLGHAGWAPGQLAEEVHLGTWIVRSGHAHLLMDSAPDEDLWEQLLRIGESPPPSLN